jgi:hypothetical protein
MTTRALLGAATVLLFMMTGSATASQITAISPPESHRDTVQHGGGCRKDSPPGKCCHAGSQPYHCH